MNPTSEEIYSSWCPKCRFSFPILKDGDGNVRCPQCRYGLTNGIVQIKSWGEFLCTNCQFTFGIPKSQTPVCHGCGAKGEQLGG